MSLPWIRKSYGVPAYRGIVLVRCVPRLRLSRITSASASYVRTRGYPGVRLHPAWRMEYVDRASGLRIWPLTDSEFAQAFDAPADEVEDSYELALPMTLDQREAWYAARHDRRRRTR